MDNSKNKWLTSVIFEHACKENFEGVLRNVFESEDLDSTILANSNVSNTETSSEKSLIKPVFLLICLLRRVHSSLSLTNHFENSDVLPSVLELLESTFKQYNFLSLKQYFTLMSEIKLLDLLNYIMANHEYSIVMQKLNHHFPRWTSDYRTFLEQEFSIKNSKILDKVEESYTQCRRLIIKLSVDEAHRAKYVSEQFSNDMNRLIMGAKAKLVDAENALKTSAGLSVIEKIALGKGLQEMYDPSVQMLLEYVQPEITDESLLRYLSDLEPILSSQPNSCLTCLIPFETMSEDSDDDDDNSDNSESECESSEDESNAIRSPKKLKSTPLNQDSDMHLDE